MNADDKYWNDMAKALEADAEKLEAMLPTPFEKLMLSKYGIANTMALDDGRDDE